MIRLVILVSEHTQEPRAHSIQLADISCREWSLIDNENCEACPLTRAVMNYNCTVPVICPFARCQDTVTALSWSAKTPFGLSLHGCVSGADSQPTGPRDFERLSSLLMKPTHRMGRQSSTVSTGSIVVIPRIPH